MTDTQEDRAIVDACLAEMRQSRKAGFFATTSIEDVLYEALPGILRKMDVMQSELESASITSEMRGLIFDMMNLGTRPGQGKEVDAALAFIEQLPERNA